MKTKTILIPVLVIVMLLTSCNLVSNVGGRVITPSNVIISENRDVSGFNAIEFSTWGIINILQGDTETLNISGPDNLVPEIRTTVRNNTLVIETRENVTINPLGNDNPLTFTIVVKDIKSLNTSGAGDIRLETLSTPNMDILMSGAGRIVVNQLTTEKLNIELSGLGAIDITGQATEGAINLSGAGSLNASDMKIETANVSLSGLGSATIWVTDQLTGNISGAGTVSYYGSPQLNTDSSGLGSFKSLGNK